MSLGQVSFRYLSDNVCNISDDVAYPPQVPDCGWYPSPHRLWELPLLPPTTSVHHLHLPHGSHDHTRGQERTSSPSSWSHQAFFQSPQELTGTVWVRSSSEWLHTYCVYCTSSKNYDYEWSFRFKCSTFQLHIHSVPIYSIIAEHLRARHLISLHCQIVFVCMYVCIYVQRRALVWCSTDRYPIKYIHVTITLTSVHACFDRKHWRLLSCRPWSGQERWRLAVLVLGTWRKRPSFV